MNNIIGHGPIKIGLEPMIRKSYRFFILIVGLVLMPFFWLGLNLAEFFTNKNYVGLIDLYRDFISYYRSNEPWGIFD